MLYFTFMLLTYLTCATAGCLTCAGYSAGNSVQAVAESVGGGKTTVKEAQADLRFADKAQAAVKSGVWRAQVSEKAIKAAQTAVNMQQLEAARSRR